MSQHLWALDVNRLCAESRAEQERKDSAMRRENLRPKPEEKYALVVLAIYGAPRISVPGEILARYSSTRIYLHPAGRGSE